jgi:hypothetical protein
MEEMKLYMRNFIGGFTGCPKKYRSHHSKQRYENSHARGKIGHLRLLIHVVPEPVQLRHQDVPARPRQELGAAVDCLWGSDLALERYCRVWEQIIFWLGQDLVSVGFHPHSSPSGAFGHKVFS